MAYEMALPLSPKCLAPILSRLDRRFQDSKIRRVFTVFQLTTILEEARHSLIIIEHDHLLYKDAKGWLITSPKVYAMLHAVLLLFSPGTDPFPEDLTRNADRVFYFDGEPIAKIKLISKGFPRKQKSQATLEAFS